MSDRFYTQQLEATGWCPVYRGTKTIAEYQTKFGTIRRKRKMAWTAMASMCCFALLPLAPFVPDSRLDTLAALSDMLFLSQASIVGLYFGATAYMSRRP